MATYIPVCAADVNGSLESTAEANVNYDELLNEKFKKIFPEYEIIFEQENSNETNSNDLPAVSQQKRVIDNKHMKTTQESMN